MVYYQLCELSWKFEGSEVMDKTSNLNNIVLYQDEIGSKIIEVLYDSEDF